MAKTEKSHKEGSLLEASHDEESRVRVRSDRVSPAVSARASSLGERPQRVARAIRFAELLLETLPQGDPAQSLLELAIKRRDEVLLEGIMKELHAKQKAARTPVSGGSLR